MAAYSDIAPKSARESRNGLGHLRPPQLFSLQLAAWPRPRQDRQLRTALSLLTTAALVTAKPLTAMVAILVLRIPSIY
jgi:hypothetical protein